MNLNKLITTPFGYKVFSDLPNQNDLNFYYEKKYYQELTNSKTFKHDYSAEEIYQRQLRSEILFEFINLHLKNDQTQNSHDNPAKFLDVGCGEGFVLKFFKNLGWDVIGIDFSTHGMRVKNPDLIPFIIQGDIYEQLKVLKEKNNLYSVIFLGNILEHVLNPEKLLDELRELLNLGGLLVITVPNDFSTLQTMLITEGLVNEEYWIKYPDHLNYFNLENLSTLLQEKNLPVIENFCDFPIEWFLVNPHSNYANDDLKGSEAHKSRVMIDKLINSSNNVEAKLNFWRSLSSLGHGRSITTISRKNDNY